MHTHQFSVTVGIVAFLYSDWLYDRKNQEPILRLSYNIILLALCVILHDLHANFNEITFNYFHTVY